MGGDPLAHTRRVELSPPSSCVRSGDWSCRRDDAGDCITSPWPFCLAASRGQCGLLLPGRSPPPPFPALSSPHTRPPRSWIRAVVVAAAAAGAAAAAAAATRRRTAGTRQTWKPLGRGRAAPPAAPAAPWWRLRPRPSVNISVRPSAGNSTSTPNPSCPTSTPLSSCRPSCGARPSRHHPQLAPPPTTTEPAAAREALRVKGRDAGGSRLLGREQRPGGRCPPGMGWGWDAVRRRASPGQGTRGPGARRHVGR